MSDVSKLIDKYASKQKKVTVSYTGLDDKKHQRTVTFNKPGWVASMQFDDLLQKGNGIVNMSQVYELAMNKTIANKITFKSEDEKLKENYEDKLVKNLDLTTEDGEKTSLIIKFPGTRQAVDAIGYITKNNNDANFLKAFEYLIKNVFKDAKGSKLSSEFFDQFSPETLRNMIFSTIEYFGRLLDFDGFQSVMEEAITFLSGTGKH